jgi:hypothetical protein
MGFARWFRGCLAIGLLGGGATPGAVSASAVAFLDHLVITRNLTPSPGEPGGLGSTYEGAAVYYADLFGDNLEPPSAGVFFGPSPGRYRVQFGTFGDTDESGGRLRLNSALGTPAVNAAGEGRRIQQVTLLSSTDTIQSLQGLIQAFHTFAVYGRFDIALPPDPGDGYGIKIQDNGPDLTPTEELNMIVRRQEDGTLVVLFGKQDFLADTITLLDTDLLVIPAGADQIEFRLERASLTSDLVTGAYRFWDGATPSAFTVMDNATEFFNNRGWARAGFRAFEFFVPEPGTLALLAAALGVLSAARRRRN